MESGPISAAERRSRAVSLGDVLDPVGWIRRKSQPLCLVCALLFYVFC